MVFETSTRNDNHYYYVMGWVRPDKINAPEYKKRFNIYADALDFYEGIIDKCGLVEIFEYIDGKRKVVTPEFKKNYYFTVEHFEKHTGLSLKKLDSLFGNSYRVISGQNYKTVKRKVEKYNKENSSSISCYNSFIKDETIIKA